MSKELLDKNFSNLWSDWKKTKKDRKKKVKNALFDAAKEMGDYFLSKNFIQFIEYSKKKKKVKSEYYFDPVTRIGVKFEIPGFIDLEVDYNMIPLSIVYKLNNETFLHYSSQIYYYFRTDDVEKTFKKFKKFNGKAESTRMKMYFKELYPKEMLQLERLERREKIKNINKIAV
jgi:hypothetical protein